MHQIGNEKEQEILYQLRADGVNVYSISRINTFNQCKYEYYKTYVERDRGEGNVYTELGTFTHEYIEQVYRGEIEDVSTFTRQLNAKMFELEIRDMDFPNDLIKNSFTKSMTHFTNNFKKLDGQFTLEKMFVTKIGEYYLMGYIDAIREHETIDVVDWKTSSKFTGSKLVNAGRQLIVYKIGLEETSGLKIDKVMWNMLKYIYVCSVQKNGKVKKKMVDRGKLIKEMKAAFEKDMSSSGMDEIEVLMTFEEVEKANDFNKLPSCITDKYWLEDCLLEYDVTDEKVEEVKSYITNTIKEIEEMDYNDESKWEALNIEKEGFYCNTLCNHRKTCPFLKQYKKDNPFKKVGF